MGQVTVGQVLAEVDELLPNSYPQEQKRSWLRQAEGYVAEEVLRVHEGGEEVALPGRLTDETLLLAPEPYHGLYRHYVEAQIHYANAETERCSNAMSLWNNGLMTLRDYWCRTHRPRQQVQALHLC